MNVKTEQIIAEIVEAAKVDGLIHAITFTACYSRSHVSAAFRVAKQRGLIVVDYLSCEGTPVYKVGPALTLKATLIGEWNKIKNRRGMYESPNEREQAGYHLRATNPIRSFRRAAPVDLFASSWWREVRRLIDEAQKGD